MEILIIGSGGREHALAWKIKQSPRVKEIFIASGNAGTSRVGKNLNLNNKQEILAWLKENPVDLVVVGPDDYLAEGIVDDIESLNIKVFGPTRKASEIEWSKSFAKNFMKQKGIPTARYETFFDADLAKEYVKKQTFPVVIKASGLALGKGVIIAQTLAEALSAIDEIMSSRIFGEAGDEIVIEEHLAGLEISTHAFCDGKNVIMFPVAQDRKRVFENDQGPNTGGMGTISPVSGVTDEQIEEIKNKIVIPTIAGLDKIGRTFKGVLFPGIMLTADGPKVIEFNARFGDPETQSYMRILETDLVDILLSCIDTTLHKQKIDWSNKKACCVVLASGGYPGQYEKGKEIKGIENIEDQAVEIFHAGTKEIDGKIVTNGGRVLGVTATAKSLKEALVDSYATIEKIDFVGKQYRKDIGSGNKVF